MNFDFQKAVNIVTGKLVGWTEEIVRNAIATYW